MPYAWAVAIIGLCTAAGWIIHRRWEASDTNVLMVYLLGVVWIATRLGRGAAIFASLLAVAAFDYTFVKPYFELWVTDRQYYVTFAVMLVTAIVISALTDRVRQQADAAQRRERETAALYGLSRALSAHQRSDAIRLTAAERIAAVFHAEVTIYGAGECPPAQNVPAVLLPLQGSRGLVGTLTYRPRDSTPLDEQSQIRRLEAFGSQVAAALDRASLAEEAQSAWERVEAEFLRNTLLSSVSHDLRTPLAAINGAAGALLAGGEQLAAESRHDLAESICSEAERMDRIVNNLLDMTRLEAGGLVLKKEWQPLVEVVGAALNATSARLADREVKTDFPDELPMVNIDATAIGQVLANLLDNAIEYTPSGSELSIAGRSHEGGVIMELADRGPGLPSGSPDVVFQKFFRAHGNSRRKGIGLGLAICRGIVEAHGGTITASNRQGGGAVFTVDLPVVGKPPVVHGDQ